MSHYFTFLKNILFLLLCLAAPTEYVFSQLPVVNGWTQFVPSADSRLVYVSDLSGNDATALSYTPASPEIGPDPRMPQGTVAAFKTLDAARAQLRNGFPDWILFKNGETWADQRFGTTTLFGRGPTEPMVITAFGPCAAQPSILTGAQSLLDFTGSSASFVAVAGIHARPHTYTGTGEPTAIRLISAPFEHFLIEDCFFEAFAFHLAIHDPALGYNTTRQSLTVRRCILTDAYHVGGGSGVFLANINGVLFEENIIDRNGWHPTVSGAEPTAFSHNTYFQVSNTNLVFRGNIVARASATGGGFRCGGIITDNLFLSNPKAIQFGTAETVNGTGGGIDWPSDFVTGEIKDNVVLDARAEPFEAGMGMQVQRAKAVAVHGNIVAHFSPSSTYNYGILLNEADGVDLHGNIVYNWCNNQTAGNATGAALLAGAGLVGTNQISNNDFQTHCARGNCVNQQADFAHTNYSNNRYFNVSTGSAWFDQWFEPQGNYPAWLSASGESGSSNEAATYLAPDRNIASYLDEKGISNGDLEVFLEQCKKNGRCNWNPNFSAAALNGYIRSGFNLASSTPTPPESALSGVSVFPNPAHDHIFVSDTPLRFRAIGMNGAVVLDVRQPRFPMQLGQIPNGVYMLEITVEKGVFWRKLVMQ